MYVLSVNTSYIIIIGLYKYYKTFTRSALSQNLTFSAFSSSSSSFSQILAENRKQQNIVRRYDIESVLLHSPMGLTGVNC